MTISNYVRAGIVGIALLAGCKEKKILFYNIMMLLVLP